MACHNKCNTAFLRATQWAPKAIDDFVIAIYLCVCHLNDDLGHASLKRARYAAINDLKKCLKFTLTEELYAAKKYIDTIIEIISK